MGWRLAVSVLSRPAPGCTSVGIRLFPPSVHPGVPCGAGEGTALNRVGRIGSPCRWWFAGLGAIVDLRVPPVWKAQIARPQPSEVWALVCR